MKRRFMLGTIVLAVALMACSPKPDTAEDKLNDLQASLETFAEEVNREIQGANNMGRNSYWKMVATA